MIHGQRALLTEDMQRVVDRLDKEDTSVASYREEYRRLLSNHGKMIRASLLLIFARSNPEDDNQPFNLDDPVIVGAAAIEMLHLATLVHDDVLDGADIRRNEPTTHAIYGNKTAIYMGDLLLSRYMEIMSTIAPDMAFIQEQAECIGKIVGGELLQESARGDIHVTRTYYERAIQGKTAELFRLACTNGVKLSQAHPRPNTLKTAHDFGHHIGMAFQIIDDIEDFDITHASGKPKLEDIREHIYTLPIIEAFEQDPSFADIIDDDDSLKVLDYFNHHPEPLTASKNVALKHIQQAKLALTNSNMNLSNIALLDDLTDKLAQRI
jgi:heptaprenyl diphosphate synthase